MEHHLSVIRTLLLVIAAFVPPCLTFPPKPVEQVCPDPTGMIGICVELCGPYGYCPNGQLCCSNGCGHVCTTPITVKPGRCPDRRFTHQCGTRCFQDGQCPGKMKCCPTSCGQACRRPF